VAAASGLITPFSTTKGSIVIDHITFGSHQYDAAIAFYTDCFATLGISLQNKDAASAVFGKGEQWTFFLYPATPGAQLNGAHMHIAFSATSEQQVQAFYETALARGATSHRLPGGNLAVNERYYGAMCKDLDQHTLEVVYWKPAA
jgi:catechol 2,3-dioxygenase-like lactoylglutathione lyase family enzyme